MRLRETGKTKDDVRRREKGKRGGRKAKQKRMTEEGGREKGKRGMSLRVR